ncbi:MarR family winged helix-turn-helix transcriptional regulator [Fusibacter sp. JL216-2]|uniref:MarR family winged helix-turn-helix transcriptional regulator n=1 Tax=Fusibacter sp. JL216-2 TaxID=3071453 RepID=UPI003D32F692
MTHAKRLNKLAYEMNNFVRKHYKRFDKDEYRLSDIEREIILHMYYNPGISLKEVSSHLDVPGSTLTSALDRLERKGLMTRVKKEDDKRSFRLMPTDQGETMLERKEVLHERVFTDLLSVLNAEEQAQFVDLMDTVRSRLKDRFPY